MPSHDPARRLDDILRSIALVEGYIRDAGGVDALLRTDALRDAVERRLLIVSEAAVKLGDWAEANEPAISWRNIRGMGNTLRHDYDNVRGDIIKLILETELPRLKAACASLKSRVARDRP